MHMERVAALGCVVCRNLGLGPSLAEVHHVLRSGRRQSHKHVIPLCWPHHRGGMNTPELVSRHPWRKEFERRYGTEQQLLEQVNRELQVAA